MCPSLIDLFITVICLDSCSSKAAEDSLDKASSLTPPDLRKTQLGAQRIFFHHCFFLFFQPLAQPFIALRASVCHLAAVDKQSQIWRQGNNSNSLFDIDRSPLSSLFPPLLLFSFHHLAQLPGEGSSVTPLSRTQMGIRKSGLVSNNYRNYFNILKQKDGEIYLFEMLTVRLNFHSSANVSVFVWRTNSSNQTVSTRCVGLFWFGCRCFLIRNHKHLSEPHRGAGRDFVPPTLNRTPAKREPSVKLQLSFRWHSHLKKVFFSRKHAGFRQTLQWQLNFITEEQRRVFLFEPLPENSALINDNW